MVIAGTECFTYRDRLFQEDAISYLDLSDEIVQGHPMGAVNPYWSPLYPLLLAGFRVLFHPNAYWEPSVVKLANFSIFVVVFAAFNFLLSELLKRYSTVGDESNRLSQNFFAFAMYCWFWWTCLGMASPYQDTPDYIVTAAILAGAAIVLHIQRVSGGGIWYAWLGLVLGLGYLAKPIGLPMAMVFLLLSYLRTASIKRNASNMLIYLACFCLLAGPKAALMSVKAGHLTLGDNASFNFAYGIEGSLYDDIRIAADHDHVNYTHPPRVIDSPTRTIEFATPIGGAYPLWTDPAYWHDGISVYLTLEVFCRWIAVQVVNASLLLQWFGIMLIVASLTLTWPRSLLAAAKPTWRLWLPGIVGVCIPSSCILLTEYGQGRWFASFVLLLSAAILSTVQVNRSGRDHLIQLAGLTLFCLYPLCGIADELLTNVGRRFFTTSFHYQISERAQSYTGIQDSDHPIMSASAKAGSFDDYRIAEGLRRLGIKEGDKVALFGKALWGPAFRRTPFEPLNLTSQQAYYYWARLAKVRIVAQICNDLAFNEATPEKKDWIYSKLRSYGVKAIILRLPSTTNGCKCVVTMLSGSDQSNNFKPVVETIDTSKDP